MSPNQLSLGLKLKKRGQEKVASASSEWIEKALKLVEDAYVGMGVDAEWVRARLGDPPRINAMGSLFSVAAKRGLIIFDHYRRAQRPSRHASVTGVWRRT